jgi:KipI family sensor histidine kinase inhibitor
MLPYGERAVLIEVDSTAEALHLHRHLNETADVLESVPAARTVLVVFDADATSAAAIHAAAAGLLDHPAPAEESGSPLTLDVRYDGDDLEPTAAELGISVEALIERHASAEYVVGFCGFSPGFAYLTGLDPALRVPRLASPRTSVPAGSVAIAGEFTGVYPRASPGGWRLLGTTDAIIWDINRAEPALLTPGTVVRFRRT